MSAANFQSSVFLYQASGVPGDLYQDYPHRAQSFQIQSASAAYNIIGATAFTISAPGVAVAGNNGGTNYGFAGILFNSKVYALQGDGTNALNPSLVLPNYTQAEFITEGSLWVTLPNTANIGDVVIYNNTTGAISSIAPGTSVPSGNTALNAFVDVYAVTVAGLAVITLNQIAVNP